MSTDYNGIATGPEIDRLAGAVPGTATVVDGTQPKVLIPDANKDLTGLRNLSITGNLNVTAGEIQTAGSNIFPIPTARIGDGAVTANKIATGAVGNTQLANGSVTTEKISTNGISANSISGGTLPIGVIPENSITEPRIVAEAVTNAKIGAKAVTYAKIQDISAGNSILGNNTGSSGPIVEIASNNDTVLAKDGSAPIAFGKVKNSMIDDAQINGSKLVANSIDYNKLKNLPAGQDMLLGSLGGGEVGPVTVGAISTILSAGAAIGKIVSLTSTSGIEFKSLPGGATVSLLDASNSVGSIGISNLGVTTAMLANSAVTAEKIQNSQVSLAKIENLSPVSVIGRSATDGGVAGNISASEDTVLRRPGSGALQFGKITNAMLETAATSAATPSTFCLRDSNGATNFVGITSTGDIRIRNNTSVLQLANSSGTTWRNIRFEAATDGNVTIRNTNDVVLFTLSNLGAVTAKDNVCAYSDISLKDDIKTIEGALEKVNLMRGVTFTRKDQDDKERRYTGVIAQEIEKVLPEVVSSGDDGIKSVAYGNVVGVLIESIKELTQRVRTLEAQLNSK